MKNGKLSNRDCAWGMAGRVYLLDDWPHRLDGPAVLPHDEDEDKPWATFDKEYWILGENYTFEDWQKHPLVVQYRNQQLLKYWKD